MRTLEENILQHRSEVENVRSPPYLPEEMVGRSVGPDWIGSHIQGNSEPQIRGWPQSPGHKSVFQQTVDFGQLLCLQFSHLYNGRVVVLTFTIK